MRIMSLDIGKICRTCLALSGPLLSIFDNSSGGSGCLADMVKDLTKMKPMPGDKMPENVCLSCISEINRCYSFKMKCENSNKTLHQLIPEAVEEEEPTLEIQKKKVRLSTKGIQTTPEKKKKFVTAQAQTIAEEKVQVCHQQVQTELHNSDKATSPVTDKFSPQDKDLQPKTEQSSPEEPQEHMDDTVNNPKQRITRSIARLANKKQTDAEKVIAFKRLTIDSEDQISEQVISEQVIYELQSENGQDITSFDGLDDAGNQIEVDEVSEADQTAYYVLSDSQGGEDVANYNIAYDSDNYEEETVYSENVNKQEQQIIKEGYNFTIINPGEEGEEEIAPVAATTSRNSLKLVKSVENLPHSATVKKCEFNCPECPMEFVSVNTLKRHCLKIHDWSSDDINVLDELHLNITEKKPSKRRTLLKYDEYIGDVILPPEVEAAIVQKLEVERYQQTQKAIEAPPKNEGLSSTAASASVMNFFCPHCNASFVLRKSLSIHMKQNQCAIKSFECPECNRVFTSEESLEEHQKTHVLEFTCAECHLVYNNNSELSQHLIDAHNRNPKNQCGICKKVFTMLSALKDHLRIHSGEKPFVCPTCGKAFRQNTNLKQHLMRHSNTKPFQCSECPLSFVSKAELISHNRVHVGGHPYKCEMCDSRYTTSSSLVKHMRKHTGERPYACEYCPRRFSVLNVLKNHRRIHTGEKPFQCVYCQKCFTQKSDCQTHQRTHTGEKPYVCHCNAAFTHLSTLRMHMKLHSKELNDTAGAKRKRRSATNSDEASPNHMKKFRRILDTKPQNQDENQESQQESENGPLVNAVTSEDDLIQIAITDVC